MKVSELVRSERPTLSFEVFPPKTDAAFETVKTATEQIAALRPDFMSVTYGAGGSGSEATLAVAENLLRTLRVPVVTHLTCVGASRHGIDEKLAAIRAAGVENVMALRGDLPAGITLSSSELPHAEDLIAYLRSKGDLSIGGACYPEVHPESRSQREDLYYLRRKVEAGCDYLVTQMFFDNNIFYNFLYKAREAGITVPILPGIMPITRARQIGRAVQLSGTNVPDRFRQIVDAFGDDPAAMEQAGVAYAAAQIVDLLANGIRHIHVYSMNRPRVAAAIQSSVRELLK